MKDAKKIEELYKLYNFKTVEITPDYLIFLRDFGYFKNLEAIYENENRINKKNN